MRTTGQLLCLALAALVVIGAAGAANPAKAMAQDESGGIGLRLIEAPVAARDDPRARIYIVDHLGPGTVIEREVEVSNSTAATHQVSLYSSAAAIHAGTFAGDEGNTQNELSSWTTVTPGAVNLAPGERRTAVVEIAVPDDAAPGEQYAVVWAEVRSGGASGVTQVSRVGIRLYVSVGSGGAPSPDFTVESLTPSRSSGGAPVVTATVRNTGGRALDVTGTLMLTDGPGGLNAGPFPAELNTTLAVGETEQVTITLDGRLPAGPWDAVVELRSGVTERRGEATITFPEAGEAAAVATQEESGVPWGVFAGMAGIAAAALLLGLIGLSRARTTRRRRAAHRARTQQVPIGLPA